MKGYEVCRPDQCILGKSQNMGGQIFNFVVINELQAHIT